MTFSVHWPLKLLYSFFLGAFLKSWSYWPHNSHLKNHQKTNQLPAAKKCNWQIVVAWKSSILQQLFARKIASTSQPKLCSGAVEKVNADSKGLTLNYPEKHLHKQWCIFVIVTDGRRLFSMDLVRNAEKDDTFCMSLHRNTPFQTICKLVCSGWIFENLSGDMWIYFDIIFITASNQSQPSLTCFRNKFDAPLRRGVASNIDASRCRLPGPYRFRLIKSVLHEQGTVSGWWHMLQRFVILNVYIAIQYMYYICTTKIVDQEGLIVVTRNSAFICRVSATNYNMSPWLSLQWPRRSCQDVCDDIEDNGNDMGWHWSDWIFAIFWRLWPSCPGCSCRHGSEINTTIWITSAFTLEKSRCHSNNIQMFTHVYTRL